MPYEIYLAHHGIKGQQWGVKNGPPYPLNSKTAQNVRRKATEFGRQQMSKTQEIDTRHYENKVPNKVLNISPIQKLEDFKRLDGTEDIIDVRYNINNPPGSSENGRAFNCPNCAIAFEMTERGYDVSARPKQNKSNVENIEGAFSNGELKNVGNIAFDKDNKLQQMYKNYTDVLNRKGSSQEIWNAQEPIYNHLFKHTCGIEKKLTDSLISQGDSRGIIVVGWYGLDPNERTTSYHAFNYKVEKRKMSIIDVQSHRTSNLEGVDATKRHFLDGVDPREIYTMRTDNLTISEDIGKYVYSRR